jgi:phospholipid transport system transporter-binding protein
MSFRIAAAGPARLAAHGELGFGTAAEALEAGLALLGPGTWVVDLAGVTSADSAGLAVLIEWLAVSTERGGTLRFESVPTQLVAIARISDLDSLLFAQPDSGGVG